MQHSSPGPASSPSAASTRPRWKASPPAPRPPSAAPCRSRPKPAARFSPWPTATAARSSTSSSRSPRKAAPRPRPARPARLTRRAAIFDKAGDSHYNLISALHKSVRGSDPDASLYWLARMLKGGEDPRFLARRITRMAVEDIGLADPAAQRLCLDAWATYERLGSPEGELALAEAVIYLALAPKSNAAYTAFAAALSRRRAYRLAGPAQAHPERAHAADEVGKATARATSTTTTPKAGSPARTTSPRRCRARPTTGPASGASRPSSEKGFCLSPPSALGRPIPTDASPGRSAIAAKTGALISV